MTRRKSQSGQAILLVALALPILLAMVGLAFDVGFLEMMNRTAQTAADAAAIAGAVNLPYGNMTINARAAATSNGFTNGTNGASVVVNNPPSLGPHSGSCASTPANCNYVEVVVSQPEPTFFLRIVGAPATSTVAARAVAYNTAGDCVFALNSSMSGALTLGSGLISLTDINTPNCAIIVDSSNSNAIANGGLFSFVNVTTRQTAVVGGNGCGFLCTFTPPAVTGIAPESDPLAYLTPPAAVACTGALRTITTSQTISGGVGASCYNYNITGSPTVTFNPGSYAAITINGTAHVTFNSGLYTLWGTGASSQCFNSFSTCSLGVSGVLSTINGTGVTFYFGPSAGSVEVSGFVNTMNLTPPTTGLLPGTLGAGVLFYQDRANSHQACIGGCGGSVSGIFNFVQVQGALYFPAAGIDFVGCCQYTPGNAYYTAYEIVVADHISLSWDYFNDDYSSLPGGSPVKRTLLSE
jgi:hypothetical protein